MGAGAGSGAVVAAGAGAGSGAVVATGTGVTSWTVVPIGADVGEGSSPQARTKAEKEARMRNRNTTFIVADILRRFNSVQFALDFSFSLDCNIVNPP